jgi:DNA invertase Pin-like site-specific DNA recombinase
MQGGFLMIIGYCRSSTNDQTGNAQRNQLEEYGCDIIREEIQIGKNIKGRPIFQRLINELEKGDKIILTKLDRGFRNTLDALQTVQELEKKGVGLVILNLGGETVDTKTASGMLLLTLLAGVAEFELSQIRERQMDGIKLAKKNGKYLGRKITYGEKNPKLIHALELAQNRATNGMTMPEISHITGISRATIYNKMKEADKESTTP